jgi:ArsR family transcriptional regulator
MTDHSSTQSSDQPTNLSSTLASNAGSSCCGGGVSRLDSDQAARLASQLSALADPARLQMLSIIASSATGEVCACDFVDPIGKSQPTISHHLKVLNEAGLVTGDKRGRWIWYRLATGALNEIVLDLTGAMAGNVTSASTETVRGN